MKIEEAVVCKCIECKRGVSVLVAACEDTACSLHPFRLWTEPEPVKPKRRTQNLSESERERRRKHMKLICEKRWGKKSA